MTKKCVSCGTAFTPGSEGEDECMPCYYGDIPAGPMVEARWTFPGGRTLTFVKHHEENLGPMPEEYRSATKPVDPFDLGPLTEEEQRLLSRCMRCHGTGWACAMCSSPADATGLCLTCEGAGRLPDEADYEALGYQETEVTEYIGAWGLGLLAETIDLAIGSCMGDVMERARRMKEKDIREATDNG